jgi:hypothetical protein
MNEQNEMVFAALTLAELLTKVEVMRKRTHKILTNYRIDELLEKRTQIRVLEKDFERLTIKKDALRNSGTSWKKRLRIWKGKPVIWKIKSESTIEQAA